MSSLLPTSSSLNSFASSGNYSKMSEEREVPQCTPRLKKATYAGLLFSLPGTTFGFVYLGTGSLIVSGAMAGGALLLGGGILYCMSRQDYWTGALPVPLTEEISQANLLPD